MVAPMRWLVIIALVACGKGKSKDECRAEADAVGKLLVEAAKEVPSFYEPPDDVKLVVRTDLPTRRDLRTGPVVTITPSELRIAEIYLPGDRSPRPRPAQTLREVAELDAVLRELRAQIGTEELSRWHPDPKRIYFAIEPTTPGQRIVAVVDAAKAQGFTAPAFIFEQPSTLTPPPRSGIDPKLDALLATEDPANRATELAKLTQEIIKKCEPLNKSFGSVASVEGQDKGMMLAQDVGPALVACNCNINIPDLRSVMFRILHVKRPLRILTFEADAIADRMSFPPATTWAEASKRFTPGIKNATLAL